MLLEKNTTCFFRSFQIAGTFTKGIYKKLSFYKLWSKFKITTLANFPQSVLCDEKYHILPYKCYNLQSVFFFIESDLKLPKCNIPYNG